MTQITVGGGKGFIESYLEEFAVELLDDISPSIIPHTTKIFVNGSWLGITRVPAEIVSNLQDLRRQLAVATGGVQAVAPNPIATTPGILYVKCFSLKLD